MRPRVSRTIPDVQPVLLTPRAEPFDGPGTLFEPILDGEVVALDSHGRQNFRDLLAGRGNLHYVAFDALWVNGKDLRSLPLVRRSERCRSSSGRRAQ